MKILQFLCSRRYCLANIPLLNSLSRPGILAIEPGASPTENTTCNNFSIVFMGGCLTIVWKSFPQESAY
jgi:hypothetical protein